MACLADGSRRRRQGDNDYVFCFDRHGAAQDIESLRLKVNTVFSGLEPAGFIKLFFWSVRG